MKYLKHLYGGFQDVDARVLKFYRKYAERWEARGHGSYGLPCLAEWLSRGQTFGLYFPDSCLNLFGFMLTTKEPERKWHDDINGYIDQMRRKEITPVECHEKNMSRILVAITTPFRIVLKKITAYGTPVTSEGIFGDYMKTDPFCRAMWSINRHIRFPMLIAGFGFLGKALYSITGSFTAQEPVNWIETEEDFYVALGFLRTSSSAYFKDGDDPKLGKKQKSILQLAQEALESLKEKVIIKVPQPVHLERRISLEEMVA